MKKKIKIITIIITIVLFVCVIASDDNAQEDNLRIRVIANSDSNQDINKKYEIVSILKKYIKADDTKETINKLIPKLKEEISKVNNDFTIEITNTKFPPKELNGKLIPGGTYETLLIKIGEAKGHNYWTLLYPEYFGISFDDIHSEDVEIKWFFKELIG